MRQWLARHWLAVLAVVPQIPALWKAFVGLLDWGGRIDFAVSTVRQAREGTVISFLLDPPTWTIFPALLLGGLLVWADHRRNAEKKVDLYLVVAGLAAVIFIGAIFGYLSQRPSAPPAPPSVPAPLSPPSVAPPSPPVSGLGAPPAFPGPAKPEPIFWWFSQGPIAGIDPTWIFRIGSGTAGYWVTGFEIRGRNKGDVHLTGIRASITAKNSGQKLPLYFLIDEKLIDPTKTMGIPPEAYFTLGARVPNTAQQMTVEEFLQNVGGFTFTFECSELPIYEREFSYVDIRDLLMKAKRQWEESTRPLPKVQPKE